MFSKHDSSSLLLSPCFMVDDVLIAACALCPVWPPAAVQISPLLFKQFWSSWWLVLQQVHGILPLWHSPGISWFMFTAENSGVFCCVSSTTLLCRFKSWTLLSPYICLRAELFAVIFEIMQKETSYQENYKKVSTVLDCKQNKENSLSIVVS